MPKALEAKLEKQAASEGLKGDRKDAYVYGTMRKTGWEPKREKKKRQADAFVSAIRSAEK